MTDTGVLLPTKIIRTRNSAQSVAARRRRSDCGNNI